MKGQNFFVSFSVSLSRTRLLFYFDCGNRGRRKKYLSERKTKRHRITLKFLVYVFSSSVFCRRLSIGRENEHEERGVDRKHILSAFGVRKAHIVFIHHSVFLFMSFYHRVYFLLFCTSFAFWSFLFAFLLRRSLFLPFLCAAKLLFFFYFCRSHFHPLPLPHPHFYILGTEWCAESMLNLK